MIKSNYYGRSYDLTREEAEILVGIYQRVAKEKGFEPEIKGYEYELLLTDEEGHLFDTIAYHVEEFGQHINGYEQIELLFD